jgi:CHAT domain-containing protein
LVDKIETRRVIVVPHNVLNYVPFAAIPLADGTLFGEKFVVSYLPSASTLAYLAKPPAQPGKMLALGNPTASTVAPLKFAEKEVQDVAGLVGGDVFAGKDATLSLVLNTASEAGVLYIAAHATFNERAPLFSALHLTASGNDDGLLEAYEVYSLDLTKKTELVVLSACETGIGGLTAGDEFSGLNRAFLYAGSPAVISTLWSVDDQATGLLMQKFFEMRIQGQSNAQALHSAQTYIRTYQDKGQTPYASPYFWAGFVLTGRG